MACSMEILEFAETCETMERLPNETIMRIIRESTQIKNAEATASAQAFLLPLVEEFSEKVKKFTDDLDGEWAGLNAAGNGILGEQLPEWFDFTYGVYANWEYLDDEEIQVIDGRCRQDGQFVSRCLLPHFMDFHWRREL